MNSRLFRAVVFLLLAVCVTGHYWTAWKDFDNPIGTGDWERISDHPTAANWRPCGGRETEFIHVKANSKAKSDILTSDLLTVGPGYGLLCNSGFVSGPCRDYKVKYYNKFGTGSSSWKDVSNPTTTEDDERRTKHGFLFTSKYVKINAESYPKGEYRAYQKIKLGPRYGMSCRNSDQPGAENCLDYKVRYYCGDYPKFVLGIKGLAPGKK